jgi:hypothetical protein
MPVAIGDVVLIRVRADFQGQEVQTNFWYLPQTSGWNGGELVTFLTHFRARWRINWIPRFDPDYQVVRYEGRTYKNVVTKVGSVTWLPPTELAFLQGVTADRGTRAETGMLPSFSCFVTESYSGFAGKTNMASIRLGPVRQIDQAGGRVEDSAITDINTLLTDLASVAPIGTTSTLRRVLFGKARASRAVLGTPANTFTIPVESWSTSRVVMSLRSRLSTIRPILN